MTSKKKIVIADTCDSFRQIFIERIKCETDFQIVGQTKDGKELISMIREIKPDIVVMESVLEKLDGLEVLDCISTMTESVRPKVIFLSAFTRGNIAQLAADKGADYFMVKPCRISIMLQRMRQIINDDEEEQIEINRYKEIENIEKPCVKCGLEAAATYVIQEIGIPAHIQGYQYLREAILIAVNDMDVMNAVTKELYPMIAKRFKTTSSRVERSMRHGIEVAWCRGNAEVLQRYFGGPVGGLKCRPTNSEFIAIIADDLRLRQRAN